VETSEGGTDSETGETRLGDGRVDDSLLTEAVEQALGDLVSASSVLAALDRRNAELFKTHAPLYWATSSPRTKTLSFLSISSAMASFRASLTVISLTPPWVA